MGATESRAAGVHPEVPKGEPQQQQPPSEEFKAEVRKAANDFKNLVQGNKVMMFSATYCSYCTVAKKTLEDLGTQFQAYEVNKEGKEGDMMMNVVQAVTGNRLVPTIFICGQIVPGGGSGLKHLATTGQLSDILAECCEGDPTCTKYDKYSLH